MRFYKLQNRRASEVFETLGSLLGDGAVTRTEPRTASTPARVTRPQPDRLGFGVGGRGGSAGLAGLALPMTSGSRSRESSGPLHVEGEDFKLTVDEATNTLIVVASIAQHAEIEKLLVQLDKRRPQVLIELKLIAITVSDSLTLGIELESLDLGDGTDYLLFSTFGLSGIDPTSGVRTLNPGVGFNGVLLRPTDVPIVMQALATRANARTLAAPRLLISDNATGTLSSVDQSPFTSVNASNTVATTSFAGFADAGTTVTVTPHIAEGDHLSLDFQLTFSSFTGTSSGAAIPPPRSSITLASTVEVPDGYTVVVGGLVVESPSDSISEVPWLGKLPLLGPLFQSRSKSHTRSRIYAFIRPIILRDDEFEDLKFLSAEQVQAAGIKDGPMPVAEPLWMR